MNAWDLTITLRHESGAIAKLGEELGTARINVEGVAVFENGTEAVAHVLVENREQLRTVVEKAGYKVTAERQVVIERVENVPGVLGTWTRQIADAGVNLTCLYTAMDGRLVFGAEDFTALESAMREVSATAGARR